MVGINLPILSLGTGPWQKHTVSYSREQCFVERITIRFINLQKGTPSVEGKYIKFVKAREIIVSRGEGTTILFLINVFTYFTS